MWNCKSLSIKNKENTPEEVMVKDLTISKWLNDNRLVLNTDKTICMILRTHQCRATLTYCTLNLKVGDRHIKEVNEAKLLGIIIDESLTCDKHIYKMCNKISKKLGMLRKVKKFIPSNTLLMLFNSLVLTACGTQIKCMYKLEAFDRKDSIPHSYTHL